MLEKYDGTFLRNEILRKQVAALDADNVQLRARIEAGVGLLRWALAADDEYVKGRGDSWLGSLWRARVGEWLDGPANAQPEGLGSEARLSSGTSAANDKQPRDPSPSGQHIDKPEAK